MAFTAQNSASVTLVASTQQTVTFGNNGNNTPIRYAYVAVSHNGAVGTVVYVRTDGTAATVGGDNTVAVEAGQTAVVANAFATWSQAASVIPPAAAGANAYAVPSGNGPSEVTPMGSSPYGGTASPGTSVSVISSGTPTVTITGTG